MRNIKQHLIVGLILVIAAPVFILSYPLQSAPPPHIGTWKFNPAKSKMNLSLPPRSLTRKYEDRGGGVYIFTQEGLGPDGSKLFSMYVAKDDGTPYPLVIQGADNLSYITIKGIDAYTAEQVEGNNPTGGGGTKAVRTVSPDGRTLTLTIRPNAGGQRGFQGQEAPAPAEAPDPNEVNIMVFDRQ
jgi:hypothetical protein